MANRAIEPGPLAPREERFRVRAGEAGGDGRLRPTALCDWFQEIAGNHAAALGWGAADLRLRGLSWVLSRLTLDVDALPAWQKEAVVSTWPSGAHRLWAHAWWQRR